MLFSTMMSKHIGCKVLLVLGYILYNTVTSQTIGDNACRNGDVRLVNGSSQYEGRVEVCYNHRWGTICGKYWGADEAATVCRQLNLTLNGEGAPVHEAYFGEGTGEIHIYMCKNNDNNLSDCTHMHTSTINWWASCHHLLDAGVICRGSSNCSDGEVRLEDGEDEWEGRVEICFNRVWGTVCDNGWDDRDARTVCQQLIGQKQSSSITLSNARTARIGDFSEGKGPILLTEVNCNKSHHRLIDCQTSTKIRNCIHLWDAGVTCQVEQVSMIESSIKRKSTLSAPYSAARMISSIVPSLTVLGQPMTSYRSRISSSAYIDQSQEKVIDSTITYSIKTALTKRLVSTNISGLEAIYITPPQSAKSGTILVQITTPANKQNNYSTSSRSAMSVVKPNSPAVNEKTRLSSTKIIGNVFTTIDDETENRTSSALLAPILGSIGTILLVFLALIVAIGIFVITKRTRKHTYEIQSYSSAEESRAIDNPVYDSMIETTVVIPTSLNGELEHDNRDTTAATTEGLINTENHMAYESVHSTNSPNIEMEVLYETPQVVTTFEVQEVVKPEESDTNNIDGDYSRLKMSDVSYATLEPYIPQRKTGGSSEAPTPEDMGYSHLKHIT